MPRLCATPCFFLLVCLSRWPVPPRLLCALQSLPVLNALAAMLESEFGYSAGRQYLRLEGSVQADMRSKMIAQFNRPGSQSKVGTLGVAGRNLLLQLLTHSQCTCSRWSG